MTSDWFVNSLVYQQVVDIPLRAVGLLKAKAKEAILHRAEVVATVVMVTRQEAEVRRK